MIESVMAPRAVEPGVERVSRPRVLIVEDEGVIAAQMQRMLVDHGYRVTDPVPSGDAAVETAWRTRPDVVLMDLSPAGRIDGIDAAARIHMKLDVPVIYLTDCAEDERLRRAQATEPLPFLVKPAAGGELRAAIELALYKHGLDLQARQREARFRALTDLSADWYWEQDEQFRFTHFSGGLIEQSGIEFSAHIGKTTWDIPADDITPDTWSAHRASLARHQPFRNLELSRLGRDRQKHYISMSGEPVFDAAGRLQGYRGIGTEITERKRMEALLASGTGILEMVATGAPLISTLDALARHIEHEAPGLLCSVLLLDSEDRHLRYAAAPSLPDAYNRAIDGLEIGPKAGSCGRAAHTGQPVFVSDVATEPCWRDHAEIALSHGLRACWSAPILGSAGRVLGTLAMYYREPRLPGQWERKLIDHAIRLAAIAIERVRDEQALREREVRLASVIDSAMDAVIVTDESLRIAIFNRAAEKMFEVNSSEMLGRPLEQLIPPRHRDAFGSSMAGIGEVSDLSKPRAESIPILGRRGDGDEFPIEASISNTSIGGRRMVTAILRDVTARKQAEAQIRTLNHELERRVAQRTEALARANRELESFSYSVSHDLRTPLRAINGFSQILLETERERLTPEGQAMLDRVAHNTIRMGELIDSILDYSRAGRVELVRREVNLNEVARPLVAELRQEYPNVAVEVAPLPPAQGDPTMLHQVLANLLGNAFKFSSKKDSPRVVVGARREEGDTVYYVRDNGTGFDMSHASKLFGMFQRIHGSSQFSGTGVGLAIVKRLVERHGGRVWADARPDRGATFYFTLGALAAERKDRLADRVS